MAKAAKAAVAAKMAGGAISGAAGAAGNVISGTVNTAGNAISGAHRMSLENQEAANDYAKSMRTQARAVDQTFGMTEEQFANLTKYDRADRAMDTTDRGLSLVERNWKAVLIIFVIVLVLYFIFRNRIKSMVGSLVGRVKQANAKSDIEQKTGVKATLSDDQIAAMCDSFFSAHDHYIYEEEDAAAAEVCKCQNQADWDLFKQVYGARKLSNGGTKTVEGCITSYWNGEKDACSKVYSHFVSHRIKDDAVLTFLDKNR